MSAEILSPGPAPFERPGGEDEVEPASRGDAEVRSPDHGPFPRPGAGDEVEPASRSDAEGPLGAEGLDEGSGGDEATACLDPTAPPRPDLARAALDAARSAARRRPADRAGRRVAGRRGRVTGAQRGGYSGAGPDPRDPQRFGTLLRRLVADRGWEATVATATVLARWEGLVGAEIAGHCQPISLRDGELTLTAESTAWATQLRLPAVQGALLARIRAELGPDVVRRVRVHGPTAPSWGAGPRRIAGRGPRDTYG